MKIGIIGAMDEELISIRAFIQNSEKIEKGKRTFWHGSAYGHDIYLTRCDPGKVNAVIATQQLIDLFSVDVIFNMGSSGALAPEIEIGDVVIAKEFIQHDFDVTDWGLEHGEMVFDVLMSNETGETEFRKQQIFKADEKLFEKAIEVSENIQLEQFANYSPKIYSGRMLSGDQFIGKREKAKDLWETYQGLCTDMESAAIAHTCEVNEVPFLCIRAMSDKADQLATSSFTDFLVSATANYGKIFEKIIKNLEK